MDPLLGDVRWLRLHSVPRPPEPQLPDPRPTHLLAAVTAGHAGLLGDGAPGALAMAWVRPPGHDDVHFLLGGAPGPPFTVGPALGTRTGLSVAYPPGATATELPAGRAAELLAALPCWIRCVGRPDVLALDGDTTRPDGLRAGSAFDEYAAHLRGAFAWLVLARPVPRRQVDHERLRLAERIPALRRRENAEDGRLELERLESRYRELTRARTTGMWDVDVLVGGADPRSAAQAAALLCSAAQTEALPYTLLPADHHGTLAETVATAVPDGDDGRSPFLASSELVSRLARPPAKELPGIRLVAPHDFDVTADDTRSGIALGTVVDAARRSAGVLRVPDQTLNRHGFIGGATGSGKSQTTRGILEQLARAERPVPWLVVEPAKAEYASMSGRLGPERPVLVIRPGEPDVPPACLNPLEPAAGFPLQSHADLVRALFLAAFEAHEPFPQVLSRAVTECYQAAGWDLVTGEPRPRHKPKFLVEAADEVVRLRYPTLADLQTTARGVVESIGYGKEVAADVRGFVDVRIGSLREGRPGRFFEGGHPLDVEALLAGNVVLELESLTNDQDKAFLMGAVLIRIVEHLRVRQSSAPVRGLRHLLVIEEAHRLLKNIQEGPAAAAVELFSSLLAEIRAYGEGVLVVEQIPSKILPDVLKNTALKVMHRLPGADDRAAMGATMNLRPEQSEAVVAFPPGMAAVTIDDVDRPLLVAMDPGEDRESAADCVTSPPLSGRRSQLCGQDCLARACTLREINDADHLARTPALVVWTETVAAAVVAGIPPPLPSAVVTGALPAAGRLLDCTLAHGVDRAVRARRAWLRGAVDGDDLAAHLLAATTTLLAGRGVAPDPRWQLGAFRWDDVARALRSAVQEAGDGVHPQHHRTAEWARRGLRLDADDLAGQLAQVLSRPENTQAQQEVLVGEVAGTGLPAALRAMTGRDDPGAITPAGRAVVAHADYDALFSLISSQLTT